MSDRKIALVTGGNRGIGFEVVRQLLMRDFEVVLSCREIADGEAALKQLDGLSKRVSVLGLDVADHSSVEKAAAEFGKLFHQLDVLVNNAGILLDASENIMTVSEDMLTQTWNTNSVGPLRVVRAFFPYLEKSNDACVINVSSLAGQLKDMGSWAPAYCISKTALNAVTCVLSNDLKQHGIQVNSVSPGWIRTEMGGPSAPGTVEEGTDTIVWLATEAPRSLTGQFLMDRGTTDW